VTARPLAPVIPSSHASAARRRARSVAARPLPLARAEAAPHPPEDVVYGIGCIDASGRIADRAVISALGWQGGDLLTLTADAGVVTARRDPGRMVPVPLRAYIALPAALRRRCGLLPGDRVLLAAAPSADTLTAYSLAVVDQAIRAHGSFPPAQGEQPLDEPTPSDVRQFAKEIKENALSRRNGRGGRSAVENFIGALRCLYNKAEDDGLIDHKDNPASKVEKPPPAALHPPGHRRHQAGRDQPGRRDHGRRPWARRADPAAAHRDRLPERRRPRAAPAGPGP
jgi:hypothetical protein